MKVEVKDNTRIYLKAENQKENHLLEVLDKNGIRVFGRSSMGIGICSPHIAGLRQLFINREQQAILSYALAKSELEGKIIDLILEGDLVTAANVSQVAKTIVDLKYQLFVAPETVYTSPCATARMIRPMPPIPIHTAAIKPERNLFSIQGKIETDLPLEQWNKDFVDWTTTRGESWGGQITPIRTKPVPKKKEES
ncbi:hypothetical protein ES703_65775 [subsurface metagenome]